MLLQFRLQLIANLRKWLGLRRFDTTHTDDMKPKLTADDFVHQANPGSGKGRIRKGLDHGIAGKPIQITSSGFRTRVIGLRTRKSSESLSGNIAYLSQ